MTNPGDPPVKLVQPRWLPLSGSELHAAMSGKRLTIDEDYEVALGVKPEVSFVGGCPPLELFYEDGRWESHFCFRGPKSYRGSWIIEQFRGGEHVCVMASDFPKSCRFVWQGKVPDRVFMPASVSSRSIEQGETFNPYSLTPLKDSN